MTQAVDGSRPQDAIGEGIRPFRDIQIGGDDGALSLVAFGDHLVEILILDAGERLEAEVVDDQKIDSREPGQLPLSVMCPRVY